MKAAFMTIVILISAISVFAQKDEDAVAKAVETLKNAMAKPNKQALENLAADNLTYGHSTGVIEDKAAFVDALVSGRTDYENLVISEQKILFTGDVATVRHRLTGDVLSGAAPSKLNISILLVWVKLNGEWKLLARQAVKV